MSGAVSFVRPGRPPSANRNVGPRGARAGAELRALYEVAGGSVLDGHLYGIVYYFVRGYSPATDADADNISKRVWDALTGAAYRDDRMVRLRLAGVVEVGAAEGGAPALQELDLSDMSRETAGKLLELLGGEEKHILHVGLGLVQPHMFVFNLAARGADED